MRIRYVFAGADMVDPTFARCAVIIYMTPEDYCECGQRTMVRMTFMVFLINVKIGLYRRNFNTPAAP